MVEEYESYYCGDCSYHKFGDGGRNLPCKRIDHDTVRFAKPWFKVYDGNQHGGCICSDFQPAAWNQSAVMRWPGFEAYWKPYVEYWIPYKNVDTLFWFTLNGDTSIRYGVPLMDFVNGTLIKGNRLKAVEKMYYIKDRKDPNGYRLIREPIDGVEIGPFPGGEKGEQHE